MTAPFDLWPPKATALTSTAEIALLEAASARRSDDHDRLKLGRLYFAAARLEDAERMLRVDPAETSLAFPFAISRGETQLGLADPIAAAATLRHAIGIAETATQGSRARGEYGKALMQLGRLDEARRELEQAIALDRDNSYAFTRLATLELKSGRSAALLDRTQDWIEVGLTHCGVLGARLLALAACGRSADARTLSGLDTRLRAETLPVPEGWPDLATFNGALTAEVLRYPDRKRPTASREIAGRVRIDGLTHASMAVFPQLAGAIAARVTAYATGASTDDGPWREARPKRARLGFWSMVTRDDGHDAWHMHHSAWLSGVYYPRVPTGVAAGCGNAGCIEFGLPEGAGTERDRKRIRPYEGLLLLFPSHLYHRTYPSEGEAERVSIAFNVSPEPEA